MEEDCSDEDSSLRDYWKKSAESRKKKREKKKKKERKGKEEADGTDQESEGTLDGAQLDPTKLTTLTSRNENPLGNLPQDRRKVGKTEEDPSAARVCYEGMRDRRKGGKGRGRRGCECL